MITETTGNQRRFMEGQNGIGTGDNMILTNKKDPAYVRAVVQHLPRLDDPQEQRMMGLAQKEFATTDWARNAFSDVRAEQIAYLKDALNHLDDPSHIHDRTQEVIAKVAQVTGTRIASGQEELATLEKGKGVLIMTNHPATFKLGGINPKTELGINIPDFDLVYPSPIFISPLYPVARELGDNLYFSSLEYPLELGDVHESAGFMTVRPVEQGRTQELQNAVGKLIQEHPNAAIVHFAEGGTTGKRNGGQVYDLEEFSTGGLVIAAKNRIPVVPAPHYFNPESGFETGVFKPINLDPNGSREYFEGISNQMRAEMQNWLNVRKTS